MGSDRKSKRASNHGLSSNKSNSLSVAEEQSKKDPFKKPFILKIYECGEVLTNIFAPSVEIDLNQWKKKYFLFGRGREHLD